MNSEISDDPSKALEGKYRILRRLAVGGMAEIYLAESAKMHGFKKKVVIKRILPQYADDPVYVDMFLDEARLVAQLNHPSIIQVFDIGEESDGVFFTMEYVEGRDLADILGTAYKKKQRLSLEEVLAIAVPTAEALHHAHELRDDNDEFVNLVHRDVSPSNVIVTNEGRIKLLDFGVAKSKTQLRATTGVSLKGKFGYMAPEQCQGLKLDRRSDIFSYGVLLWELFAGKRLFPGGNEPSVLMKIMDGNYPTLTSVRPDLPERLDDICSRALAVNRDERYPTLQVLLDDLDEFRKESGTVTTSRTLSTMLTSLFGAPTRAASEISSAAKRNLPLQPNPRTNSEVLTRDPSVNSDIGLGAELHASDASPQQIASSTPGRWTPRAGLPLLDPASGESQNSHPPISARVSVPTPEHEYLSLTNPARKRGVLIALGFLLVAGVASLALGLGSDTDSEAGTTSSGSESLESQTNKIGTLPGTDAATENTAATTAKPVDKGGELAEHPTPPDIVPNTTPAKQDTGANKVAADSSEKLDKTTRKRQRNKNRRTKKKRPATKPKWDPNSPFAPE